MVSAKKACYVFGAVLLIGTGLNLVGMVPETIANHDFSYDMDFNSLRVLRAMVMVGKPRVDKVGAKKSSAVEGALVVHEKIQKKIIKGEDQHNDMNDTFWKFLLCLLLPVVGIIMLCAGAGIGYRVLGVSGVLAITGVMWMFGPTFCLAYKTECNVKPDTEVPGEAIVTEAPETLVPLPDPAPAKPAGTVEELCSKLAEIEAKRAELADEITNLKAQVASSCKPKNETEQKQTDAPADPQISQQTQKDDKLEKPAVPVGEAKVSDVPTAAAAGTTEQCAKENVMNEVKDTENESDKNSTAPPTKDTPQTNKSAGEEKPSSKSASTHRHIQVLEKLLSDTSRAQR